MWCIWINKAGENIYMKVENIPSRDGFRPQKYGGGAGAGCEHKKITQERAFIERNKKTAFQKVWAILSKFSEQKSGVPVAEC